MRVLLAALSAACVAAGAGLVYLPAGLVVAGLEGLAGAYIWTYLGARREAK